MKFLFKSQGANAPCDFFFFFFAARGIMYPHPPSRFARHPPPTEPPTQTMFARGPVVAVGIRVWYRSGTLLSIIVTTPALRATPPQRGTLARDGTYQFPSIGGVGAARGGKRVKEPALSSYTLSFPRRRE